jgi:hypothetical protein
MKKMIAALAITTCTLSAFADHSLMQVMQESESIRNAVRAEIVKKKVFCEIGQSLQMNPTVKGAEWRQVVFCFKTKEARRQTGHDLMSGNQGWGIYGLQVSTILDVEYSRGADVTKDGRVISISLK